MTGKPAAQGTPARQRRAQNRPPDGPGRFADTTTTTRSNWVYQELHRDIVSMKLLPGAVMSENAISKAMGVSRTPVREAVLRLAKERLVEVVPQSGTFVARISLATLTEALVVRRALEAVTVRAATQQATAAQITAFRTMIQQQRDASAAQDTSAFHEADEQFHAAFAKVGNYPGIWQLIHQVKVQIDRYRRLTLPQVGRTELIIQEHEAIVDAMAACNAPRAVECMERHLDHLQLDIAVFRDMWPDYFILDIDVD